MTVTKRRWDEVTFIVQYDDGRTVYLSVEVQEIEAGDHVARLIAGEAQLDGRIPDGAIHSVRRHNSPNVCDAHSYS
jgi:hypothetical protein